MDAALLFLVVTAAGALILALVRRSTPPLGLFQPHDPVEVTIREESKTFSLDDLPRDLQAQGNELAQLALKGKAGGAGLTQADKERMVELARTLAERAPGTSSRPVSHSGEGAIRLVHVEEHPKVDLEP